MSKLIKQDRKLAKGGNFLKQRSTRISTFIATWAVNEYSVVEPLAKNLSSSRAAKCTLPDVYINCAETEYCCLLVPDSRTHTLQRTPISSKTKFTSALYTNLWTKWTGYQTIVLLFAATRELSSNKHWVYCLSTPPSNSCSSIKWQTLHPQASSECVLSIGNQKLHCIFQ